MCVHLLIVHYLVCRLNFANGLPRKDPVNFDKRENCGQQGRWPYVMNSGLSLYTSNYTHIVRPLYLLMEKKKLSLMRLFLLTLLLLPLRGLSQVWSIQRLWDPLCLHLRLGRFPHPQCGRIRSSALLSALEAEWFCLLHSYLRGFAFHASLILLVPVIFFYIYLCLHVCLLPSARTQMRVFVKFEKNAGENADKQVLNVADDWGELMRELRSKFRIDERATLKLTCSECGNVTKHSDLHFFSIYFVNLTILSKNCFCSSNHYENKSDS